MGRSSQMLSKDGLLHYVSERLLTAKYQRLTMNEDRVTQNHLDAGALAEEFGTSQETMQSFIDRFAPSRVAENHFRATADCMLFVHIPKTAGVSLGSSLRDAFDTFRGVEWNNVHQSFRHASRHATYMQTRNQNRQVIMGHFGWPELQIWRNHELPLKCGTVFRDPIARAVSNYNYNCSDAHPDRENFMKLFPEMKTYLASIPVDVQLSQAIGWVDSFETVMRKLLAHYTFIGITEKLSDSLQHLGRSHGLPNLREYRKNVGKKKASTELADSAREVIVRRSYNDLKIHKLITRLYET